MTLAAMLITIIEAAEHHSQWQTFDARTLRAAAVFVAELRGEGK